MNLIPVEGQKDLYRDPRTNAIINTNKNDYECYIMRRESLQNQKKKIELIEDEITDIRSDLNEIKTLLIRMANNESKWYWTWKFE